MKETELLQLLEQAVEKLSITLEYDDLRKGAINTTGGAFVLRGERHILLHKHLAVDEKVELLSEILSTMDTESLHLAPVLRHKIELAGEKLTTQQSSSANAS
ncbi:hypothetical protein MNBD_DELTA01-1984 [hydrothermal vent metagenome]|uniref:Uncharacterized protein n=1 Tax=hydrothermal vent metagenome TaxID=652676 RepID=A0A3B0RCR3_9ZZZZ